MEILKPLIALLVLGCWSNVTADTHDLNFHDIALLKSLLVGLRRSSLSGIGSRDLMNEVLRELTKGNDANERRPKERSFGDDGGFRATDTPSPSKKTTVPPSSTTPEPEPLSTSGGSTTPVDRPSPPPRHPPPPPPRAKNFAGFGEINWADLRRLLRRTRRSDGIDGTRSRPK